MKKSLFKNLPIDAIFTYCGTTYQKDSATTGKDIATGSIKTFSYYTLVNWHKHIQPEQYHK